MLLGPDVQLPRILFGKALQAETASPTSLSAAAPGFVLRVVSRRLLRKKAPRGEEHGIHQEANTWPGLLGSAQLSLSLDSFTDPGYCQLNELRNKTPSKTG